MNDVKKIILNVLQYNKKATQRLSIISYYYLFVRDPECYYLDKMILMNLYS